MVSLTKVSAKYLKNMSIDELHRAILRNKRYISTNNKHYNLKECQLIVDRLSAELATRQE